MFFHCKYIVIYDLLCHIVPLAGLPLMRVLFKLWLYSTTIAFYAIQQVGLSHITVMKFSNYHLLSRAQDAGW